ncbi:hypothetical protein [Pontibacter virosus]|nr:hypothetical protein [Pontibacter virosus]
MQIAIPATAVATTQGIISYTWARGPTIVDTSEDARAMPVIPAAFITT